MVDKGCFPDGRNIDEWFYDYTIPKLENFESQYLITDYGVKNDGEIHTERLQRLIDMIHESGGGVIVVPEGEFLSGALFFRQGVSLFLADGAILKGSDRVTDYPILKTRIEGQTCNYLSALINVDGVDGFSIFGKGTIDGNGQRSWEAFWHRKRWNPDCTNKDEQRPRLIYVSNSKNVVFYGCTFKNSHFWTTHIYKSNKVKYLNCNITSPKGLAPSTDAIDVDVCNDVLIKGCFFAVNDDAVVLKGGKGYNANLLEENGSNERVIIEDCEFGFCHSCLTFGSESLHDRNIIFCRSKIFGAARLLWLKLRPDTTQEYEYVKIEKVFGEVSYMLFINSWMQFFQFNDCSILPSKAHDIIIRDCELICKDFFNVAKSENYKLYDFVLSNIKVKTSLNNFDEKAIENLIVEDLQINM